MAVCWLSTGECTYHLESYKYRALTNCATGATIILSLKERFHDARRSNLPISTLLDNLGILFSLSGTHLSQCKVSKILWSLGRVLWLRRWSHCLLCQQSKWPAMWVPAALHQPSSLAMWLGKQWRIPQVLSPRILGLAWPSCSHERSPSPLSFFCNSAFQRNT